MPVSALVLAAGLGTRLDPLTRLVAKPAVPLGDRTLVEHVLAWVRAQGIRDVVLNLHHRPATLTAIVGDGAHLGLSVRYSWEAQVLGSAGGPRHALPLLASDPFLLVNGDTLCDFDVHELLEVHARNGALVTLAVVPNPAPDRYNGIVADASGRVTGFVPRGAAEGSWHFVGVQVASRSVFAPLPDNVPAETVKVRYRDLIEQRPGSIQVRPVATTFVDVGTPRDYLQAALALAGPTRGQTSAGVSGCVVWPEARIGTGVRLSRCIVAGPIAVPDGFAASDRILFPAALATPADKATLVADMAVIGVRS
jgi:NDP-sugar pyrophosphorylase family protein